MSLSEKRKNLQMSILLAGHDDQPLDFGVPYLRQTYILGQFNIAKENDNL